MFHPTASRTGNPLPAVGAILALAISTAVAAGDPASPASSPPPAAPGLPEDAPTGGIVTLYAKDDLACAFDFRNGDHGARIVDGQVTLDAAQVVYDALDPERLSVGFSRDELVRVLDLGPIMEGPHVRAQDRTEKYAVSAYHSLFLDGSRFSYIDSKGNMERLIRANRLLDPIVEDDLRSFTPEVGHVYLIRFEGRRRGSTDQVAKFQVIDVEPGRWVTLRWAPVATL